MSYYIAREIERFESWLRVKEFPGKLTALGPYAMQWTPPGVYSARADKSIDLTFMGIVHGNEFAGLGVLNRVLAYLASGVVQPSISIAFVLGNPVAARENRRFIDRDLNRSFARATQTLLEEQRALELSAILRQTAYMVDFHQTTQRSLYPFFIFPFARPGYEFARAIGPRHVIVTHWGKPFSTEGQCTDEFVNAEGGVGISFELGQNGFDSYQIGVGLDVCLSAIDFVTQKRLPAPSVKCGPAHMKDDDYGPLYTWAEILPWPNAEYVELEQNWFNFKDIQRGQILGRADGVPIQAGHDGAMLFPKYLTAAEQRALSSRPTELCRIMRLITAKDLPG